MTIKSSLSCIIALVTILSVHAENDCSLLVYGSLGHLDRVGVYEVNHKKHNKIIDSNQLRPQGVHEDWSRNIRSLQPLLLKDGKLYYYIQRSDLKEEFIEGVYVSRILERVGDELPKLLIQTPQFINIGQGSKSGDFFGVSQEGELYTISISGKTCTKSHITDALFASGAGTDVIVVSRDGRSVSRYEMSHPENSSKKLINEIGIKKCYVLSDQKKYVIEKNWKVAIINYDSIDLVEAPQEHITCVIYDTESSQIYYFSQGENDAAVIYLWDLKSKRQIQLLRGVFNSKMTINRIK